MRRLLFVSLVALSGLLFLASTAHSAPLKWHGTATTQTGTLPVLVWQNSGIATVNNSTGYGHLNVMFNQDPFTGVQTAPVTDPEVTQGNGIVKISASLASGGGTFSNISGAPPLSSSVFVGGFIKVCLYDPNCVPGGFLPLDTYEHLTASTENGIGVGGLLSIGGFGGIRISLIGNPWTIGNAAAVDETDGGNFVNRTTNGFAHGPASLTSSTAKPSGVVQFVTPTQVTTNLTVGSSSLLGTLTTQTYHFIPEPGMLLLLGSGAAGLVLLGRARMRK